MGPDDGLGRIEGRDEEILSRAEAMISPRAGGGNTQGEDDLDAARERLGEAIRRARAAR